MSKHTRGPWHYEAWADPIDQQTQDGVEQRSIHGPDNHGVPHAMVYQDMHQGGCLDANARLIIAAPDLLAACKKTLRIVEPHDDPERWGGVVCKILRDAIAKAEGKDGAA